MTTLATHTLIVWENIPESTDLFLIPDEELSEIDHAVLTSCHNSFINISDTSAGVQAALDKVNDALCDTPAHYGNPNSGWGGRWVQYKVDSDKPIIGLITHVYCTGFLL